MTKTKLTVILAIIGFTAFLGREGKADDATQKCLAGNKLTFSGEVLDVIESPEGWTVVTGEHKAKPCGVVMFKGTSALAPDCKKFGTLFTAVGIYTSTVGIVEGTSIRCGSLAQSNTPDVKSGPPANTSESCSKTGDVEISGSVLDFLGSDDNWTLVVSGSTKCGPLYLTGTSFLKQNCKTGNAELKAHGIALGDNVKVEGSPECILPWVEALKTYKPYPPGQSTPASPSSKSPSSETHQTANVTAPREPSAIFGGVDACFKALAASSRKQKIQTNMTQPGEILLLDLSQKKLTPLQTQAQACLTKTFSNSEVVKYEKTGVRSHIWFTPVQGQFIWCSTSMDTENKDAVDRLGGHGAQKDWFAVYYRCTSGKKILGWYEPRK